MSHTLEQIRDYCKERADMEESEFISDATWNLHINNSLAELHDLLVKAYGDDYYLSEHEFTSTADEKEYALPSDFYKLRGVDGYLGGTWVDVHKFNFNKRNSDLVTSALTQRGTSNLKYRLAGSNILFSRVPATGTDFKLWYTPQSVVLVVDADEWTDINGYLEYVIVDVAMKVLGKEESDTSDLLKAKAAMYDRLTAMAMNRDANETESVSDIYDDDYFEPG